VNLASRVGKGNCKGTNVYTSRKCWKAPSVRHEKEHPAGDIRVGASVFDGEGMLGRTSTADMT